MGRNLNPPSPVGDRHQLTRPWLRLVQPGVPLPAPEPPALRPWPATAHPPSQAPAPAPAPRARKPTDQNDVRLAMECPFGCGVTVRGHVAEIVGEVMGVHVWLWHEWQFSDRHHGTPPIVTFR
ncbi:MULTISPECIES: hypothetical protein [unclassified Crossiella]|uniref:hypothetical protein n=1 Tax=unclassified Crossiella TaxID=2620835 RepID=UPI001FFE4835|nr:MULTISPECIES: hypothetical protein [unclassified Crossiella]MCK2239582.1 hypothetical protein [Crossiella sp. S99.2]MCK2252277.1 hypothetical protein [Crossiella sp. S99.1]